MSKNLKASDLSTIDKTLSIIERSRLASKINNDASKTKTVAHVESVTVKKNVSEDKSKRDIKDYLVVVDDLNKFSKYERERQYLRSAHNSLSTAYNEYERALKTFYRDAQNNLFEYNRESSYKLVKDYIKRVFKKSATKDYFTTSEVELHYKVFGPSISDNTLASCRKLQQEKAVRLEAVMCSDVSKRVKYYKIHVVKQ